MRNEAWQRMLFKRKRARLNDAKAAEDQALAAEVLAAIEFFQEHGHSPTGYEIIDLPTTR